MSITHGRDCPKVQHVGGGYLHDADHDGSYDVDGVSYCGRCHGWMGTESSTPAPLPASDSPGLDPPKQDVLPWLKQAELDYESQSYRPASHYLSLFRGAVQEIERLRALHASTEGALRETAWLIGRVGPQWWTGRGDEWTDAVDGSQSHPARSAMRFARREDAERAIGWLLPETQRAFCQVEEHIWG